MAAALGGVDGIVLTGGMGIHAPAIREKLAAELGWLGITFNALANARSNTVIWSEKSAASLLMIPIDEGAILARDAAGLLGAGCFEKTDHVIRGGQPLRTRRPHPEALG